MFSGLVLYMCPRNETEGGAEMLNKNLLKAKMVSCGFSQRQLAKRINMSENTLSAKMCGRGVFDTEQIEMICDVLHITDPVQKADIFLASSSQ